MVTGHNIQVLKVIKELEDARTASYRRRGVSRKRLRLDGLFGVDEEACKRAISRKMRVSTEYSDRLCHSLCESGFLSKAKNGGFNLTQKAIEAMTDDLSKRGLKKGKATTMVETLR